MKIAIVSSFLMLSSMAQSEFNITMTIPQVGNGMCYSTNRPTTTTPKPTPTPKPKVIEKSQPDRPILAPSVPVAGDMDGCIAMHNQVRQGLGLKPIAWNSALAKSANKWANHLNAYNLGMTHSTGQGENLYRGGAGVCSDAMVAWVKNERSKYAVGSGIGSGNFEAYGHYTQIVYRATNMAGCSTPGANGGYFVCHYAPQQISGSAAY